MFEIRPLMVWILPIFAAVVGAVLITYGSGLPVYHDAVAARDLFANAMVGDECASGDWHQRMAEFRTLRYPLLNLGCSLIAGSLAFALIYGTLLRRKMDGIPTWRTPGKKVHFFVIGISLTIIWFAGSAYGLILDGPREMFPWCADSIAIPLFGMAAAFPILFATLILSGWIIALAFGELPVGLVIWNDQQKTKSWVVTVFFGIIFLIIGFFIYDTSTTADFITIFPGILALYLTLATRAALLAPCAEGVES